MEKRFDGWSDAPEVVHCNQCEHMYTSACDGKNGDCKAYKAVRGVNLDKKVNTLNIAVIIVALSLLIHLLVHIFS